MYCLNYYIYVYVINSATVLITSINMKILNIRYRKT